MRAIRSAVLAILLVAVIGALACSSDGTGMSRRAGLEALETNAVAVADADDAFANVHDATVDAPMSMDAVVSGPDWRHDVHTQLPGSHLGPWSLFPRSSIPPQAYVRIPVRRWRGCRLSGQTHRYALVCALEPGSSCASAGAPKHAAKLGHKIYGR